MILMLIFAGNSDIYMQQTELSVLKVSGAGVFLWVVRMSKNGSSEIRSQLPTRSNDHF